MSGQSDAERADPSAGPSLEVAVFEKEDLAPPDRSNSGVVHAGIYYRPGSLEGRAAGPAAACCCSDFCAEHGLPYDECGKLVVAVDAVRAGQARRARATRRRNDVPGLAASRPPSFRRVSRTSPDLVAAGLAAHRDHDFVASPSCSPVIEAAGGGVRLVDRRHRGRWRRRADRRGAGADCSCVDRLVVCGGLQADRGRELVGGDAGPRIVPFRGEYLRARPASRTSSRPDLPGARPALPVPRRALHAPGRRRRSSRAQRRARAGPRGLQAAATSVADLRGRWRGRASGGSPASTGARASTEVRGVAVDQRAYLQPAQRYVPALGVADVDRAAVRRPRPGRRPGRQHRRRLP